MTFLSFQKRKIESLFHYNLNPTKAFSLFLKRVIRHLLERPKNFPDSNLLTTIEGSWTVSFDTVWGGPGTLSFAGLEDWTLRPENGVKYYSGIATYTKTFDFPVNTELRKNEKFFLDLGEVNNLARVQLNGKDMGTIWTAPWKVDISEVLKEKENKLEIEVANLWPNRLIGDEQLTDDGIKDEQWPEWLLNNKTRTSGRYTFSTFKHYDKNSSLLKSGLIGPVTIEKTHF